MSQMWRQKAKESMRDYYHHSYSYMSVYAVDCLRSCTPLWYGRVGQDQYRNIDPLVKFEGGRQTSNCVAKRSGVRVHVVVRRSVESGGGEDG